MDYKDLLIPYADFLALAGDGHQDGMITVSAALLIEEAKRIAKVQNGLQHEFPLEQDTSLGWYFRLCRIGEKYILYRFVKSVNSDIAALAKTLLDAEHTYIRQDHNRNCEQLIDVVANLWNIDMAFNEAYFADKLK